MVDYSKIKHMTDNVSKVCNSERPNSDISNGVLTAMNELGLPVDIFDDKTQNHSNSYHKIPDISHIKDEKESDSYSFFK